MASSDEEGEILPNCIRDYYFVDYKDEPISFSILPLQWSKDENPDGLKMMIFLRGSAYDGLQKIYKQVIAWKFELSSVEPEIFVLSKDKNWMELQSPRKSFQNIVRTILVTVSWLHFVKRNPEASGKSLWNHLLKSFSSYEFEPSENDLLDHMPLIQEAVKREEDLLKSKDVHTMRRYTFIDDRDDNDEDEENDEDNDELFDSVCAICDNGGELLCCEGRCLRSFHATVDAGTESFCESLGFSDAQVEAIQNFLCKNCQYQQHQCFVCGMLGSSNESSGAEVFRCASATCGRFYHPYCVAKRLHPMNNILAKHLQNKIAGGVSFTCPLHKCFVCKRGENKGVDDLQFALCRRCPKAYHRKCLPGNISFECIYNENIMQRAWIGLLPNRILIYCMEHKINRKLRTPERNHIRFPDPESKGKKHVSELPSSNEKVMSKKRNIVSEIFPAESTAVKMTKLEVHRVVKDVDSTKFFEKRCSSQGFDPPTKQKINDATKKFLRDNVKSVPVKICASVAVKGTQSSLRNYNIKPKQQNIPSKVEKITSLKPSMKRASSSQPLMDAELETRIVDLMKSTTSSFSLEEFREKQKVLCSYSKNVLDSTITQGKVEVSVKAIRTALEKLEKGCSIEDAKAVCEPEVLNQIMRWKRKLKVYLAPFLHGMRYTSFGRHFTKVEKLREVVDRLHWYVQHGDMIVDFCCGSNDFSCLMKEKLDKVGKSCSFKNYDLIQPKDSFLQNDFSFEKRDWMSIHLDELPAGSQLIMGLNPPFGVKASLANKFIDKALSFRPKLLILIVPKETKRLDEKDSAYDLIWEDEDILSGKSFYLPGSVDMHDKQLEQWNLLPPLLYLWSRPDWTSRHKAVAQKCGHISIEQKDFLVEGNNVEREVSNYLMEENHDCYGDFSNLMNDYGDISSILDNVPEDNDESEPEGTGMLFFGPSSSNRSSEVLKKDECDMGPSIERLKKECEGKEDVDRIVTSIEQSGNSETEPKVDGMCIDMEISSPVNSAFDCTDFQSLLEDKAYEAVEVGKIGFGNLQRRLSGNKLGFKKNYVGIRASISSDTDGQSLMNQQPFPRETHKLSTRANIGFNSHNQFHGYINPGVGTSVGASYKNEPDKQRSETNTSTHLPLNRQNHDLPSQGFILPNQGSDSYHVGSLPYAPAPMAQSSYPRANYSSMQLDGPQSGQLNHMMPSNYRPPK
ncbi:protein ENHANCED DOWNY MILDEW 2 isoform X5 [Vitis vinifera]|uniref:protein ENHANCED DOWNY MILDEW 2 isoform X5 n=1 Tax=Vitis vinifera TaxID=29760 RepID=UPI0008FEAF9C|nr:protein ENHANCED DOWNY MILDEW 2 isoform X5 [Vitis vinifera]|eukprot:XP_019079245.1 PREDICTED: protein ENHANCED DOWNY MILDEW 2 isoform X4 [Vitis vinifera]